MKIVVLDGYTLNPGDLSWAELEALGDCAVHGRSAPSEVVARSAGARIVLVNKVRILRETMERLPELKYVGVMATGYNVVDLAAARQRGIVVTNVPTYSTPSVVQMTFAHVLNITQRVAHHARTVRDGRWSACEDFCYWDFPLVELEGLTLGIVGLGRIGSAVAKVAQAFGMNVIGFDVRVESQPGGVERAELDELFARGDVVSLHCPLTDATAGMVDARRLALMKPSAMLINMARGGLVDEAALAKALTAGRLAAAGLDVLAQEPPPADHPLLKAPNCFITPHIAWATQASRGRLLSAVAENIRAFLAGRPVNVVT